MKKLMIMLAAVATRGDITIRNCITKHLEPLTAKILEQFIDVTERVLIKDIMRKHGAKAACMSGSGPSVFGIFEDKDDAEKCLCELRKSYEQSYLCSATDCGCEEI